jgi:hypothetical protein
MPKRGKKERFLKACEKILVANDDIIMRTAEYTRMKLYYCLGR